ncbi:MAG: hypothetical protein LBS20_19525 [Prevotella sp.]|jgi:hypothetical protein|nr:hypothetical protein [Prevotella sp.]
MKNKKISSCNQIKYREFPELLFGLSEDGIEYFNATYYIHEKGNVNTHTVEAFETEFLRWIKPVTESYSIPSQDVIVSEADTGHLMIEESLSLLFMAYMDPDFGVYMLERISEMLIAGIALSDTTLITMARNRFTNNDLTESLQTGK